MAGSNPTRLCECGCGQQVNNRFARGHGRTQFRHGHAQANSPTWNIWGALIQRCTNPNNPNWPKYGGRGIGVCDRWRKFENFLSDMGERPSLKHSIDRVDNEKGYSPDNCRWTDAKTQANNRRVARTARLVTAFGEIKTMSEWSRDSRCAVSLVTLDTRISRYKWTPEKSIITPPQPSNFHRR